MIQLTTQCTGRARRPSMCFLGPFAARVPGFVTTQGFVLAELFSAAGHRCWTATNRNNRALRFVDLALSCIRHMAATDVAYVEVYSGNSFLVADLASRLVRRSPNTKLIMAMHGGALPEFIQRHPAWVKTVLSRGDVVVAPSTFLTEAARTIGIEAEVVPNVVQLSDYDPPSRGALRPRLFWMRSFHPIYDPLQAIKVLKKVREVRPDATLVMGGTDRGLEGEARRLASELGLGDAVEFAGYLDAAAKRQRFSENDIYLNTNLVDNTPVAVLEACANGQVVVSTDVGGIPHLLSHEHTALLAPAGDTDSLAASVLRLLNDANLVRCLRANGQALAESCSWPSVYRRFEEVFRRLHVPTDGIQELTATQAASR